MKKLIAFLFIAAFIVTVSGSIALIINHKLVQAAEKNNLDSSYNAGLSQGIIDANTAALIHISEVSQSLPAVRSYYSTERVNFLTDSLKHSRDSILLVLKEKLKN